MLDSIEILTDIVGVNGAGEICHPYRVRVGVHTAKFCINFKKNRNKSFAAVNEVILRSLIEEGEFKKTGTIKMVVRGARYTGHASALRPRLYKGEILSLEALPDSRVTRAVAGHLANPEYGQAQGSARVNAGPMIQRCWN
jgi:hypothetical protein